MSTILHTSDSRGHADHGWLKSYHTFSFASYYDPARMHFGALRVLNDDYVAPGMGFGKHPHDNMEIISIPLDGDLEHGDNMGNQAIIRKGDVQVMSAGTGIVHSEKNKNNDQPVKFLQIWVIPDQKNVQPRYDQRSFTDEDLENRMKIVVSPMGFPEGVNIHQQAWFSLGKFEKGRSTTYNLNKKDNGVYAFILEGDVTINDTSLHRRDGLGITSTDTLNITADSDAFVLLMEVPMGF
jgi:quercetin 2,3-dioxygenase